MRTCFTLRPLDVSSPRPAEELVEGALRNPVATPPLTDLLKPHSRVCVVVDDHTRPTPHRVLIPPLVRLLTGIGIPDKNVTFLIALGTHRPMTREEMEKHLGPQIVNRFRVLNHAYSDPHALIQVGFTPGNVPIKVNRLLRESDFVLGISSIVPHAQVGWGGGGKIILPGVSGAETVGAMHRYAASLPGYPRFAGQVETPVRLLIEEICQKAGLSYILNAVFNAHYQLIQAVAGDPIKAHRKGVETARDIFLRPIPEEADVVLVDAHPADLDYWQGLKPLTLGHLAVKKGGILILKGGFPEGISGTHGELARYGRYSKAAFDQAVTHKALTDGACIGALYQHILVREHCSVFCVSPGLSAESCQALGFERYNTEEDALTEAERRMGKNATVGKIFEGGEVVPVLSPSDKIKNF